MSRGEYQNLVSESRLGQGCLTQAKFSRWWEQVVSARLGSGQRVGVVTPVTIAPPSAQLLPSYHRWTGHRHSAPARVWCQLSAIFASVLVVTIIRDSWDKRIGGVALVVITFHNTHALPPCHQSVHHRIKYLFTKEDNLLQPQNLIFFPLHIWHIFGGMAVCRTEFWWIVAEVVGIHWETRLTKILFGKSLIYVLYWLVSTTVNFNLNIYRSKSSLVSPARSVRK